MSLSIGIVGLPNVGKSTLFKALTKNPVDIQNYPFCTIDPNIGIVQVPDKRLNKLSKFSKSQKTIPATIEFVDIAGLVKGAAEGEGLGNKFLANIREVDVVCEIVRIFENENITHVHSSIDPENDIGVIETELALADLETINKRIKKLEKEVRARDKEAVRKMAVAKKIKSALDEGWMACDAEITEDEYRLVKDLHLLTFKPFLYVYNSSDYGEELSPELKKKNHLVLDIKLEEDLIEMSEEEKKEFGVASIIDKLIVEAYSLLGLITYFTTGEDETRAWTVRKGSTAPEAGMAIHTDFKEKFIRANVINWQDLLSAGSYAQAREKGLIRTEGKEYVVRDGDVVEFMI